VRIAIAKPEYGTWGGFERVVDRIADHLERIGHDVIWLVADGATASPRICGVDVADDMINHAYEYFRYLSVIERFRNLDPRGVDVVLCTQPGSWAVRHECKVALFYHHLRVFYDLAERYAGAGFVDARHHAVATAQVRATDGPLLDGVRHFLVPSREVQGRLERFNGVYADRRSAFLAGGAVAPRPGSGLTPTRARAPFALCVSRHEWPKRTELAVEAAYHLRSGTRNPVEVVLAGGGSRLGHVVSLDQRLTEGSADAPVAAWDVPASVDPPSVGAYSTNLEILGPMKSAQLTELYESALCVLAPAYLEDYGLTAVEAMAHGKPVIVCRDGGGLLDTVCHGENGLVVDPNGRAIAEAVAGLRDDSRLRDHLSQGASETAAAYTWDRAAAQLELGIEQALS
jgi:glycosyltransferase involved in cell wall biosynthesis